MKDWPAINEWRKETRKQLLARRLATTSAERGGIRDAVARHLINEVPTLKDACIGFYWPFRAELNLTGLVRDLYAAGARTALPVVVERKHPVEFWNWTPESEMRPGIWDIPVPVHRDPVSPTILLVPLLGFDADGYRLGNGGGYYDRTLAGFTERPLALGVGYAHGRLNTIHPQPHDIPMDAIITEDGVTWHHRHAMAAPSNDDAAARPRQPASAPCYMHEADPSYFGYLTDAEIIPILNQLLEAERAGAHGVAEMAWQISTPDQRFTLRAVATDEARFCAMLHGHIERLGGDASSSTGAFLEKLRGVPGEQDKITLLNKGQGWVARRLREILPKIRDTALIKDLKVMLDVHERNIATCTDMLDAAV